jgi:hypothetical protein
MFELLIIPYSIADLSYSLQEQVSVLPLYKSCLSVISGNYNQKPALNIEFHFHGILKTIAKLLAVSVPNVKIR